MSIQEHLSKIRNAIYGREVRESIAKGIETAYDDASEKDNANMEVKIARGTHPTLRDRLNEVDNTQQQTTTQLAQIDTDKMDKDTTNISVNQINKNNGKLDQTYMTDEFLQQMAGTTPINAVPANQSITNSKLSNHAVTPNTTTFAKKGKNLFNGYFENIRVAGSVPNGTISRQDGAVSAVLKVEKNKTYAVSFAEESQNDVFRLAASVGYPEEGDRVRLHAMHDNLNKVNISVSGDEDYIIIYLATAANGVEPINFQIEQGGIQTSYESPHKVAFDFLDNSISHRAVKSRIGFVNSYSSQFNVSFKEEKITTVAGGKIQFGDERYDLIDGEYPFARGTLALNICFNPATRNIEYVASNEIGNSEYENLIIVGFLNLDEKIAEVFGFWSLEGESVKPSTNNGTPFNPSPQGERLFITDMVDGLYKAEPTDFNPYSVSIEKLYDPYDALVAEFPDYVSRVHLGDDEGGYPLYMYEFKPTPLRNNSGKTPPKIIATCTHGHEVHATYGMQFFFDELARLWREKDELRMLRWNVHFIVVPNVNPWGFVNRSRPNFNGVDLNRNYSVGWSPTYTDIDYDYPGEEPLSEFGTQTMDQLLLDNQDALFVLDNHNFGGDPSTGGRLLYASSDLPNSQAIGEQHVRQMATMTKGDGRVAEDAVVGQINLSTSEFKGSFGSQISYRGLEGFLLENTNHLNDLSVSSDLMQFNIESVGNTFLTVLRYFSR